MELSFVQTDGDWWAHHPTLCSDGAPSPAASLWDLVPAPIRNDFQIFGPQPTPYPESELERTMKYTFTWIIAPWIYTEIYTENLWPWIYTENLSVFKRNAQVKAKASQHPGQIFFYGRNKI